MLPKNGFMLIDSAERSKHHPDTWAHPAQETLEQIQPGYIVKVGVTHAALGGERFWGLVKEKTGDTIAIQVDQDMLSSEQHRVADGDILIVHERNIFGIIDRQGMSIWEAE